ncbi:MAG: DNA repair protein RecO, partial [Bacteroidales bacterium]|nr:DNA repair protein RecO [Bacteroidales bacterium]
MRVSGRGVVTRSLPYGDSRRIVNIYTEEDGMRGFIVRMPRKAGGKVRASFFFPLSQIEFSYERKPSAEDALAYLMDIRQAYTYRNLYDDVRKNSMAFFMAEVLSRCITRSEPDARFFSWLWNALQDFDAQEKGFADFHLFFLLEIASLLGVSPHMEKDSPYAFFDLWEGAFSDERPLYQEFSAGQRVADLQTLLRARRENTAEGFFTREQRIGLLQT